MIKEFYRCILQTYYLTELIQRSASETLERVDILVKSIGSFEIPHSVFNYLFYFKIIWFRIEFKS